jgi:hypothetical protein
MVNPITSDSLRATVIAHTPVIVGISGNRRFALTDAHRDAPNARLANFLARNRSDCNGCTGTSYGSDSSGSWRLPRFDPSSVAFTSWFGSTA